MGAPCWVGQHFKPASRAEGFPCTLLLQLLYLSQALTPSKPLAPLTMCLLPRRPNTPHNQLLMLYVCVMLVYVCRYVRASMGIYAQECVWVFVWKYVFSCVYMQVRVQVCVYGCVCKSVQVCLELVSLSVAQAHAWNLQSMRFLSQTWDTWVPGEVSQSLARCPAHCRSSLMHICEMND